MRSLLLTGLAAGLLLPSLPAQTSVVSPPALKDIEGYTTYYYGLGYHGSTATSRSCRWQQIHDTVSANPLLINSIALRRDMGSTGGQYGFAWAATKADMELSLSTSPVASGAMTSTFANNVGKDVTTVIARTWVNFPAVPLVPGAVPQPFQVNMPFDTGKSFLLAGGAPVCWDLIVHDNDLYAAYGGTGLGYYHYYDATYKTTSGVYKWFPGGCFTDAGNYYSYVHYGYTYLNYYTTGATPNTWRMYGYSYYGPAFGTGILFLSTDLLATPMPIAKDFLGSGICNLFLNPINLLPIAVVPLNYYGYGYIASDPGLLALPDDPNLYSVKFYTQWVSVDQNATRIYTSNPCMNQMNPYATAAAGTGISRTYASGTSYVNATGSTSLGYGYVVKFN